MTSAPSATSSRRQCVGWAPGMLFEDVFELCRKSKEDILRWLRRVLIIGDYTDQDCPRCTEAQMRLFRDASYSKDEMVWKCTNRKCSKKVSVRKGSWLGGSHLMLEEILKLSYMWVWRCDQEFILRECCMGSCSTIVDWCSFAREVCAIILGVESQPIGGVGKIVEIDESEFGKRKYHKGSRVDGVWVFGGIERESRCFMVSVEDRTAANLIPIIKQYILPGTKVMSDCRKSYDTEEEGYIHGTVNHILEFVNSETSDHTKY